MTPTEAMIENTWRTLSDMVSNVRRDLAEITSKSERSETAGGVRSYTLANAPLAVNGGMSDGTSYIDLAWISNGRKSGEGVGAGTGVLAYYDASSNTWKNIDGYTAVTV